MHAKKSPGINKHTSHSQNRKTCIEAEDRARSCQHTTNDDDLHTHVQHTHGEGSITPHETAPPVTSARGLVNTGHHPRQHTYSCNSELRANQHLSNRCPLLMSLTGRVMLVSRFISQVKKYPIQQMSYPDDEGVHPFNSPIAKAKPSTNCGGIFHRNSFHQRE